ncbi:hypothetical protein COT49_00985 [candidate division WWE3 bacterium CG08_land_8_20_14_0_20_40_13]|uniref:Glycosyltransferase 2-like domain-containing protein n=1 Tax=candidate division WWE3 bacterium CG08_land_8_20_14_0_20_40_13 TaxID=1975084 RepID=A0A2H0XEE5_UNCKA|nr:MAG: hypothetical protein COT49_00985 [candidate division WWE3 bacterium CG08_land_8_20_14_0_20_40_13]
MQNNTTPLVSIVTTAYKNEKFNERYFNTVNKQSYPNIEVIFVDNLSPDNTASDAKERIKKGRVVESPTNSGCADGNNLGVLNATGKYIFLLGPDTWVDKECVGKLVAEAEKDDNQIYTSKQMTYDGKEFISCGISADLFGYPARTYSRDGKKQLKKIFYADGSSVFMKRENYLKVGMMDEATFLFAEDVDLSWKARMLGMSVIPVPESIVYHFSGGAIGIGGYPGSKEKYVTNCRRRFLAERNIIRNILKNYSILNVWWVLLYYLSINLVEIAALVLTGQALSAFNSYFKAYIWNIRNIKDTIKKRKEIQRIRTASDWEVMRSMYFFPHKVLAFLELGIPKVTK